MKDTMKAARIHEINGPIVIDEIPIPKIGHNDVLLKVMIAAPNGGDIHLRRGDMKPGKLPMVVNHLCVGMVEEVGSEVINLKKGDRVSTDPTLSCMDPGCHYCQAGLNNHCPHVGFPGMRTLDFRTDIGQKLWEPYADGGMAEYWKIPAHCCTIIPDNLSFEQAAEAVIAVVTYRALMASQLQPGETIILNSCTGGTGATAIPLALLWDPEALIVIGRNDKKLNQIKEWAPDVVHPVSSIKENVRARIMEITQGQGADRLIDFSPNGMKTVEDCLKSLRNCGRAVLSGATRSKIAIPYPVFMNDGITITGTLAARRDDEATLMKLMSKGKLNFRNLITHRYPLSKVNEAFDVLESKKGDPMAVIVLPQEY
jgi:alcohol dehydrogenase